MNITRNQFIGFLLACFGLGVLVGVALLATDTLHIWEDGSWAIGNFPYILRGCLPGGLCNL